MLSSFSREHAAIVHHTDGRLFLIDLASSHGTKLDGRPVPKNKPVRTCFCLLRCRDCAATSFQWTANGRQFLSAEAAD